MGSVSIAVKRENKFLTLVSPHRICVVTPDSNKIFIGRGSIGVLNNIRYYQQQIFDGPVLRIGDYCETSVDAVIMVGGEHNNSSAWNLVYAGLPVISQMATSAAGCALAFSKGLTDIGDNVTLSYGCLVLSGVSIGKGSVVGANAVVSKTIPECSVKTIKRTPTLISH